MPDASALFDLLLDVRRAAVAREEALAAELAALPEATRASGTNLAHYLAARGFDLREAQGALAALGLSSLGRSEGHVLATLDAVLGRLAGDTGRSGELPDDLGGRGPLPTDGERLLDDRTDAALGPPPARHQTRVMVTLPSAAAGDPSLVDGLVAAGMSVARVNCAHDGPAEWQAMIAHVRAAAERAGRGVRVACDLAGPKLRTGPLPPEPGVLKVRPERDRYGREVRAARLAPAALLGPGCEVRAGDVLRFTDARGRRRALPVVAGDRQAGEGQVHVRVDRTCYLVGGLGIDVHRAGVPVATGAVPDQPPVAGAIEVHAGDTFELRRGDAVGGSDGGRGYVYVDVPELFTAVTRGERVLIDDGKVVATVTGAAADRVELRIERPARAKIRAEKGINLPDTKLPIGALGPDDLAALEVVGPLADLIALSFVSDPDDVTRLHAELARLHAEHVGVVLKIEHERAFEALPVLLPAALAHPPAAVMVARGDLAVEVGYGRLAEVQEEILWLCEAAHVPVIWATQVLDTLAKTGTPTRAEVTDAAWAIRAECVMLNKGPYITDAVRLLDGILHRMRGHRHKRTPVWRPLSVADPAP